MSKTIKIILFVAIIVIGLSLIIWGIKSGSKTEQIKIGVIEPMTGQGSTWGNQAKEGALLAEEDLLASGKKIKVVVEDSKNDPKEALTAFKKLSEIENINGLVSMGSGVMLALAPNITDAQIPTINGGAVAAKLSAISPYEFNIVPLSTQDAAFIVGQILDKFGHKKIALLVSNDDAGISSGDIAKMVIEEKGNQVVAYEKYQNSDTDFKTQILKIKQSEPDVLFLAGGAMGLVTKQIRELGLTVPIYSYAPFENPDFITQGGKATEGVIYTGLKLPDNEQIKNFDQRYEKKFGHKPSLYSYTTYDAVSILAKYLQACNQDKSCVLNKLQNEDHVGLYNSAIKFNDKGELVNPEFYLKTVKDGQFVKYE